MEINKEVLEKVEKYIIKNYKPSACAFTSLNSEGNYDDVFNDGYYCGLSYTLYEIGTMLGIDLEEPEEPNEDEWY